MVLWAIGGLWYFFWCVSVGMGCGILRIRFVVKLGRVGSLGSLVIDTRRRWVLFLSFIGQRNGISDGVEGVHFNLVFEIFL